MNDCPPKPGLTDMMSTRSSLSITCISQSSGVAGLNTSPAVQPVLVDEADRAVDVLGRLRMEADVGRTGAREVGHDAVDRLHHQVHVDREPRSAA